MSSGEALPRIRKRTPGSGPVRQHAQHRKQVRSTLDLVQNHQPPAAAESQLWIGQPQLISR